MSTKDRSHAVVNNRDYEEASDCKLELLVEINHVVSPQAIDVNWDSWIGTNVPIRSPSFLDNRSYTLRSKCNTLHHLHAFIIGVYNTKDNKQLPLGDLQNFCSLLNNPKILKEMLSKYNICAAPFSAATQHNTDCEGVSCTISGIGFHCHCTQPFSLECWSAVNTAAMKILSVGKGITSAKNKRKNKA
ncbi:nuclear protein UL55 [Canid alphaherpesvirus 1]|uniref:Nuclear protein UL55 n=1 Tax=Canid alphaherpesvirus 1 TaxID=170325 RepID=A0A172DSG2_9ALPH|nr:nuclear protein UL55 [Canid alphaherpesvirus 1]ALL25880.1 nuclear protein UL55 [Canid alphaherpesvirus 1]ALL25960.1 nuclear protein UL55 [Canid alphaherpesvirus 1]ALL26036.1 nuclear protein UL55 [Canid alphaherpesvirus 1]AQX83317.1 nuclear protein UL55 [Canid alphaherpesvirus 1]ARE29808.1 nuclear protein UL55 [Canid alphaherpesvirus 1]